MISKIAFIFMFSISVGAASTDDEIIKDLDFFQNMELLGDENPFASVTLNSAQEPEQSDKTKSVDFEKSANPMENKQ